MPADPGSNASAIAKTISNAEVTKHVKDKRKLKAQRNQGVALVWQQRSEAVRGKIEGADACVRATGGKKKDPIALCGLIHGIMFHFQSNKDPGLSILALFSPRIRVCHEFWTWNCCASQGTRHKIKSRTQEGNKMMSSHTTF